jgi:diguanylate cyclase (GGDEF)-like protein
MLAVAIFSILASLSMTCLLMTLFGVGHDVLVLGMLISVVVPAIVAPLATHFVVQLLFELERARGGLLQMATHDSLTQVYNRHYFMQCLANEVARAERDGGPLSLLMIDADEFKAINDRYGHALGDDVLREVARACMATLRPYDVLARYGGEEFVVLMPATSLAQACDIAERIRATVAALRIATKTGGTLGVTVSLGVGPWTSGDSGYQPMLQRADAALYAAKHDGRNRWATTPPAA